LSPLKTVSPLGDMVTIVAREGVGTEGTVSGTGPMAWGSSHASDIVVFQDTEGNEISTANAMEMWHPSGSKAHAKYFGNAIRNEDG